ncbi:L-gulonolactone oxidase-like [Motacilla alba alba]|uniref:L-gulonolactone oxidase-like n=1 Tax=Motacilla alba alba TaxID=1094192 RepID=UPI0018D596A2|nr:L-gulonolactone oxidase-like [Motacilla alba alba]
MFFRQILELARQQRKRVKVVGGGHSPSDIACTDGFMIHMGKLNRVLKVDKEQLQVKVEAGILLSQLNLELDKHGMALANLGAVSEVSAAGVIGTGTHNTGIEHGILPTQVVALSLLVASGEVLECSGAERPELFRAARLHLGALGVVLDVTFQCVPRFRLREIAFPASLTQVLDELEEHLRRSRFFRFLWFPHTDRVRVIYQDPTAQPPKSSSSWFWDYAVGYHLLEFLLWISSFFPGLVVWINRLFFRLLFSSRSENVDRSHRIFNYECRFRQHVQDWAIPM